LNRAELEATPFAELTETGADLPDVVASMWERIGSLADALSTRIDERDEARHERDEALTNYNSVLQELDSERESLRRAIGQINKLTAERDEMIQRALALSDRIEKHGSGYCRPGDVFTRELARDIRVVVHCDAPSSVTHQCPPDGSGAMPCCDRTPFEVPDTDCLTSDEGVVTCRPVRAERAGFVPVYPLPGPWPQPGRAEGQAKLNIEDS
jgi:hypothetical protein